MTNAPAAEQARLLDLAGIDTELRQVSHQRRSLPEHAELTSLAAEAAKINAALTENSVRISDLERAVRKAEADVEQVRTRVTRDTERLNSGAGSAKDLVGLQHELTSLARRQSELEDVELEVMEELEGAQTQSRELEAQAAQHGADAEQVTARRDAALTELAAREADLTSQRDQLVGAIQPGLLAIYDRVSERSGVAAARLVGSRCGACRVEFPAVELATIRRAAPDVVVQCEECSAILIRE